MLVASIGSCSVALADRVTRAAVRSFLSLEDELFGELSGKWLEMFFDRVAKPDQPAPSVLVKLLVAVAQNSAEKRHSGLRKDLLKLDDNLGDMLAFSGRGE